MKLLMMINIPGQETSGRYVIVQMDNGEDQLNLQEVKAFGRVASNGQKRLFYVFQLLVSNGIGGRLNLIL